jgi:hypothetical protein
MALRWKEFSHDDALGDDSLPATPGQRSSLHAHMCTCTPSPWPHGIEAQCCAKLIPCCFPVFSL